MRIVLQRVTRASVEVEGVTTGAIGTGLLALVGVAVGDTDEDARVAAAKIAALRVFPDADGKMNVSVADAGGTVLVVSQFTLLADVRKGRRPAFTEAADARHAVPVLAALTAAIEASEIRVEHGRFGARMLVDLVNDGPVTIVFDVTAGRVS